MTITKSALEERVRRFLAYGAEVRRFSPATIEAYRRDLSQFCAWVRQQESDPLRFDYPLIGRYVYYRVYQHKVGLRSMNRTLSTIKSMIKYLIASEGKKELQKLLLYIKSARVPTNLPTHLSVEHIDAIIPQAVDFTSARNAALIELLYSTGCRISELLSIGAAQVERGQTRVLITGKGSRQREVYIGERAVQAVARYLPFRAERLARADDPATRNAPVAAFAQPASASEQPAAPPLFVSAAGRRLTRHGANAALKQYQHLLSLHSPLSAHVFRHSFATHILDSGANIRTVQELLGHASLSSTQIYTHVSAAKMQRVYRQAHPHSRRLHRQPAVVGAEEHSHD